MSVIFGYSLDTSALSRPTKESMSQQTLMELLISNFDDKSVFRDPNGDFHNISEWTGVAINQYGEVTKIKWMNQRGLFDTSDDEEEPDGLPCAGGSIHLQWLPRSLKEVSIPDHKFYGTMDTSDLPHGLVAMHLSSNELSGHFETQGLPRGMVSIDVSRNQLCGSFDVSGLPLTIERISVCRNALNGTIRFSDIPQTVKVLNISFNGFSGVLDFSALPQGMTDLRTEKNAFETPEILVVPSTEMDLCTFDGGSVNEIRDVDGKKLWKLRYRMQPNIFEVGWSLFG